MSIFKRSALILAALAVAAVTTSGTVREAYEPEPEETPAAVVEIEPVPPAVRSAEPVKQVKREEATTEPEPETTPEQETPAVWREDVPLAPELQSALLAICEEAGVDPLLALGLIETESGFQPDIVSPWGDYGLCQLNHLYFPTDLTPEENMRAGIGLLAQNMERYGTVAAALTAYNRGHDDGSRSYAAAVLAKAEAWGYAG